MVGRALGEWSGCVLGIKSEDMSHGRILSLSCGANQPPTAAAKRSHHAGLLNLSPANRQKTVGWSWRDLPDGFKCGTGSVEN